MEVTTNDASRTMVPLRNELKFEVRRQESWWAARVADIHNIPKYGNRAGPTSEAYQEVALGVFKSIDGKRVVRLTGSDLARSNNHAGAPHLNLETGRTVVKPNGDLHPKNRSILN